jgi:hypothetical protein
MKLDEKQIEKIDPLLRDVLKDAEGDEVLRVVMVLESVKKDSEVDSKKEKPDPTKHSSQTAYRESLIEERQREVELETGETRRELENLSLEVRGGKISKTCVVEGSARQILASLELPGVHHASLDQPIELIEPRRRKDKESQK